MCIILRLCSSIVSIRHMDEGRCQVLDNGIIICIHGYEHILLAKIKCSKNRLYLVDLNIVQLVCLVAWHNEEPWLRRAHFEHLSFDVLGWMAR
jgi:hypothetical protein